MKRILYLFLALFYCCTQNVEKPANLIGEEKMVSILTDIYIHQQSSYMNEAGNGRQLDYARINAHLLKQHNIEINDFEKSYEYYVLTPELYEPMLEKIKNNLENQLPEQERLKRENLRREAEKAAND